MLKINIMLKNFVNTTLTGGAGLLASETAPAVIDAMTGNTSDIVAVIVQLIIGVATLLGLIKNKKVAK